MTSLGKIDTLLDIADLANFEPNGEQAIYALMTCSASRFAVPGLRSLGEDLLASESGGIAVWGPSGLSTDDQAQIMATEFLRKGLEAGGVTLGEAIASAQAALLSNGGSEDMPAIYQLFGDPAMTVLPKAQVVDPGDMDGGTVVGGTGLSGGSAGCAVSSSTQNSSGWLATLLVLGAIVSRRHRHGRHNA